MKKKFLSLMMAAAVVATTSVSAFAAVENNVQVTTPESPNIKGLDNEDRIHNVDIIGHVQNQAGEMPTANFKVTVPTAANFTVTNGGRVVGPRLEVKNEGPQGIEVYATDFYKETKGSLKVVAENELSNKPRSTVSLKLTVNGKDKVHLAADETRSGVFKTKELNDEVAENEGKLLTLAAGTGANGEQTESIQIEGSAGTGGEPVQHAVKDTFKLVLKIKKAPVNS